MTNKQIFFNFLFLFKQTFPKQINYSTAPSELVKASKSGANKNVGLIVLNRPKALNALNKDLMSGICKTLDTFEEDKSIGTIVITGSEKAFSVGGDLKEMQNLTYSDCIKMDLLFNWARISKTRKPLIAAVNGWAIGGGMEIAMMCDIIYAGDKAKFKLPEVQIGTIPGAGGTQRLVRSVGKAKAMQMILTGEEISAEEAERMGLVAKIFPAGSLVEECLKIGEKIASFSNLIVGIAKDAVNSAYETTLNQGIIYEKKAFHGTFATRDRLEGMSAFIEKRKPVFKNE